MIEIIYFHEYSNVFFCALFLYGNERTAGTTQTVGIKEHLPAHRET